MFPSEAVARVIHAERVRDLERAARERRMLAPAEDQRPEPLVRVPSEPAGPATDRSGQAARVPA
jgi:hypothetical protein